MMFVDKRQDLKKNSFLRDQVKWGQPPSLPKIQNKGWEIIAKEAIIIISKNSWSRPNNEKGCFLRLP